MAHFRPTSHLRYKNVPIVYNQGSVTSEYMSYVKVLQQLFVSDNGKEYEWREIPVVENKAKDKLERGDPELEGVLQ